MKPRSRFRVIVVAFFLSATATLSCAEALRDKDNHHYQEQEEEGPVSAPVDPEAALRFGHHILRSHEGDRANALAQFDTLASGSGFPTGETLFLLGRAHDEGREDIGIRRDEAAARDLYERAAKLGHPQAQHALSVVLAASAEGGGEVEAILYDFFASLGGDPLAHAALGYRYLYGIGTVQNCAQSLQHYQVAARETIADLYSRGRGGIARPIDRTRLADRFVAGRRPTSDSDMELVDLWEASAEIGDLNAIRTMGVLYQHGIRGIEQDLTEAFQFFDRGVAMLDFLSTANAGNLLMRGAGTTVDYKTALRHFKSTKTNPVSLNGLGYLYYHGLGVKQDIIQAYDYLDKARTEDKDNANPDIKFNLGLLYLSDQLVDSAGEEIEVSRANEEGKMITLRRDRDTAMTLLKDAASRGHVEAAFQAALLYADQEVLSINRCKNAIYYMKNVVERGPWMDAMNTALRRATAGDYAGALVLYSRLAEMGCEVAQSNAAWLLESTNCCAGSSPNATQVGCEKRALRLYEHAARQGRASAEMKVGDFHYYGKADLSVDYEAAARRYLKAAEGKHAEALFGMGYMHQTGTGVPQDLFLAKRYFDDAAGASNDAVPVARLSLFLLKIQSSWMGWRDWWRDLQAMLNEFKSPVDGDLENALPSMETLALLGLAVLLGVVSGVQAYRRQRARRREGRGEAAG